MSLVVHDGSVPIPEDIAAELGFHEGTPVRWERAEDGALTLRRAAQPKSGSHRLRGLLKPYLKPGESGVESFLRWREEDARLDRSE